MHYKLKKALAKKQKLEFMWRQEGDSEGKHDMFTHLMPFFSYDVPHSCGPDPAVCCQFDFARLSGYGGCPWCYKPKRITDSNVHERAQVLLDQYVLKKGDSDQCGLARCLCSLGTWSCTLV